jgi:dsRNA-specific ribonuclease
MSEAFLALVAALNESSGAERSIRFVLDLVAPQLHGLDLTHVWNLDNPMGYLVKVN